MSCCSEYNNVCQKGASLSHACTYCVVDPSIHYVIFGLVLLMVPTLPPLFIASRRFPFAPLNQANIARARHYSPAYYRFSAASTCMIPSANSGCCCLPTGYTGLSHRAVAVTNYYLLSERHQLCACIACRL